METSLIVVFAITFAIGLGVFRFSIPLAHRFSLVDVPNSRRRHLKPMPIIGGASLFAAWAAGIAIYSLLKPDWFASNLASLLPIGASVGILIGLGLIDDLTGGLGPKSKLLAQLAAAAIVLAFEPKAHGFCLHWKKSIGFAIWPLAAVWLIGLSNAINLVDGLDGLAGGISLLVSGSVAAMCLRWGPDGSMGLVLMTLLMASIAAFLRKNWHPAEIFLGDNGSLPLGFVIGTISLTNPDRQSSWAMVVSMIFMMGYPILDMGLCTFRRLRHGHPIFKADRSHLHHRLLRFGLTVPQIAIILLSMTFYLQLTSLCIDFMKIEVALLYATAVGFSLFSLLYTLRTIEQGRVKRISLVATHDAREGSRIRAVERMVAKISLEPLFEAGIFEERERLHEILSSLKLMLKTLIRKEDLLFVVKNDLNIIFSDSDLVGDDEFVSRVSVALKEKLALFQRVYNLQYSLADLPVRFERESFLIQQAPEKAAA